MAVERFKRFNDFLYTTYSHSYAQVALKYQRIVYIWLLLIQFN